MVFVTATFFKWELLSGILHVFNRIVPIRHKYCLDHSVNKPEFRSQNSV